MPLPEDLSQNPPLVMIVDDESDILDMLEELLKTGDLSLNVVRAQSGVAALLMIGEYKPDLLILDIMMPGMNGLEVCQKLRASESTQNVKIIAISGDHNPVMKERILNAGADLFFTKPLDIVGFREQCLNLLQY